MHTPKTLNSVQYARAAAAVSVVVYHCVNVMNAESSLTFAEIGQYGVDLFFVISGFIMVIATKTGTSPATFILNRIVRIAPMYWIATIAIILVSVLFPHALRSTSINFPDVIMSFLFIPHYHNTVDNQIWPILIQGWTLNYEMFFYAIFAISLLFKSNWKFVSSIGSIISLIVLGLIFDFKSAPLATYTSPLLFEFAIGMIIALVYKSPNRWYLAALILSLAIVLIIYIAADSMYGFHNRAVYAGVSSALIISIAILLENRGVPFDNPAILLVANASYSIYLFHTFALGGVRFAGNAIGINWTNIVVDTSTMCVATLLSIGCGLTAYLLVERPIEHFRRRRMPGGRPERKAPNAQPSGGLLDENRN